MTDQAKSVTPSAAADGSCFSRYNVKELWRSQSAARKKATEARAAALDRILSEEKKRAYQLKRREDMRRNSAAYRARMKQSAQRDAEAKVPGLLADLNGFDDACPAWPTRDFIALEVTQFASCLKDAGSTAAQYRRHRYAYMRSRITLLEFRGATGFDPGYASFARLLSERLGEAWTKEQARSRLKALLRLEGPDGPWSKAYPL